jgi:hypothetical protein
MRKTLSILLASMLLLSGMHISIASHFCSGELAAVKLSFSGELATCGMETGDYSSSEQENISSACCHNQLSFNSVDNNYNISSPQLQEPTYKVIPQIYALVDLLAYSSTKTFSSFTNVFPPGQISSSAVSLPDICVFRI